MDTNTKTIALFISVSALTALLMGATLYVAGVDRHAQVAAPAVAAGVGGGSQAASSSLIANAAAAPAAAAITTAAAPATAAPAAAAAAPAAAAAAAPRVSGSVLPVVKAAAKLPVDDPFADAWNTAPLMTVPLLPQMMAMPSLEVQTIPNADIQAMTDGKLIAFRVSWADAQPDMNVDTDRFTDAVALQFPLSPGAPFTMGVQGMRVQILHWKALWQKDIDEHFQDVQDLYPNYWTDLYWFAEAIPDTPTGSIAYRIPQSFKSEESRAYLIGHAAGNPMSDFERVQPVEVLVAEGFGSLTHQPTKASGRGVWRDGRWSVVMVRELRTNSEADYQFPTGGKSSVALAVWQGSAGEVGGRKQWSNWVEFEVKP